MASNLPDSAELGKNEYQLPLDNRYSATDAKEIDRACVSTTEAEKVFVGVIATALRNHKDFNDYVESYMTGRLLSIVELCDFQDQDDQWMPASVELFSLLAKRAYRHCCSFCCKWNSLPLVARLSRKVDLTGREPAVVAWLGERSKLINLRTGDFSALVDKMEKLLASAPDSASAEHVKKRARGISPPALSGSELAAAISELWKSLREWFFKGDDTKTSYFSFPFKKYRRSADFKAITKESQIRPIKADCERSQIFPLVTGTLPLSVEQRFADEYMAYHGALCEEKLRRCLIPKGWNLRSAGIPFYVANRCYPVPLIEPKQMVSMALECAPCVSTNADLVDDDDDNDDDHQGVTTSTVHTMSSSYHSHEIPNFGLKALHSNWMRIESWDAEDYSNAFLTLVDHVALLEELCSKMPVATLFEKRGESIVVNPLFFLTPSRLRNDYREGLFAVVPAMSLFEERARNCIPYELIARGASIHRILCNNLARILYLIASGKDLPDFGVDDDDDGIARMRFATTVSSMSTELELLSPNFMHLVLCLYFGDCELQSVEFKSHSSRAFFNLRAFKNCAENSCLASEIRIINKDIMVNDTQPFGDDEVTVMDRPVEGLDYFLTLLQKRKSSRSSLGFLQWETRMNLVNHSTNGTRTWTDGFGPHRELLALLLLDLCKHSKFKFELNEKRHEIQMRRFPSSECRVCCTEIARQTMHHLYGSTSKCVLDLDLALGSPEGLATRIVHECLAMRVSLPVVFGLSALYVAFGSFGSNEKLLNRFLYAEHGWYAQLISSQDFASRNLRGSMQPPTGFMSDNRRRLVHFKAAAQRNPTAAYLALYEVVNAVPFWENASSSVEMPDDTFRKLVLSLLRFNDFNVILKSEYEALLFAGVDISAVEELLRFTNDMAEASSSEEEALIQFTS